MKLEEEEKNRRRRRRSPVFHSLFRDALARGDSRRRHNSSLPFKFPASLESWKILSGFVASVGSYRVSDGVHPCFSKTFVIAVTAAFSVLSRVNRCRVDRGSPIRTDSRDICWRRVKSFFLSFPWEILRLRDLARWSPVLKKLTRITDTCLCSSGAGRGGAYGIIYARVPP